jgi:hypothetical protein
MAPRSNEELQKLKYMLLKAFTHFQVTPKQSIDTITYHYEIETYSIDIRKQLADKNINWN